MKRLVLIRHGKSSWKYDLPDRERPLKKRGYKDGRLICNAFQEFFRSPVVFWSSPAVRAFETAKMFKEHFQIPAHAFEVKEDLYTFDASALLKVLKSCEDDVSELFVFGHNPALTKLANKIGDQSFENVPTTGLVVIDFEVEAWSQIEKGKTLLHLFPKNLRP